MIRNNSHSRTNTAFDHSLQLVTHVVVLSLFTLTILSLFRLTFHQLFTPASSYPFGDVMRAYWLGFRIDLSLVSYIAIPPFLLLLANQITAATSRFTLKKSAVKKILAVYYIAMIWLIAIMALADFAFYSYFSEHINIMIFGVFDDDTAALWKIAQKNYNLGALSLVVFIYAAVSAWGILKLLSIPFRFSVTAGRKRQFIFWLSAVLLLIAGARGSFSTFPLLKNIPDVATDRFINNLPINAMVAFQKAAKQYRSNKSGHYDLIATTGYKDRIRDAFTVLTHAYRIPVLTEEINDADLATLLLRKTEENPRLAEEPPHVIVVMVESFGLPITRYQCNDFNILGSLKKHFDEDILFDHFISSGNGTITSLEPLLLDISARPGATALGQSEFLTTEFPQAAARVYQNNGYDTRFVYGGDQSWRNIGTFMSHQGFTHVDGKASILSSLNLSESSACHDWGVFDQYAYEYIEKILQQAKKPQFIFLLTTNNHPPYDIPADYHGGKLQLDDKLKQQLTGNITLAKKRFRDYQYALDMAGRFLDNIKSSSLRDNTVVAITADNNTIEGIMHYKDFEEDSKKIPFYLYLPKHIKQTPVATDTPGSHKDLFPTLYSLTLSNASYTAVGSNLFDPESLHCGFNEAGIIISSAGAFTKGSPGNEQQQKCDELYRATLAVGEYLIQSQKPGRKKKPLQSDE